MNIVEILRILQKFLEHCKNLKNIAVISLQKFEEPCFDFFVKFHFLKRGLTLNFDTGFGFQFSLLKNSEQYFEFTSQHSKSERGFLFSQLGFPPNSAHKLLSDLTGIDDIVILSE